MEILKDLLKRYDELRSDMDYWRKTSPRYVDYKLNAKTKNQQIKAILNNESISINSEGFRKIHAEKMEIVRIIAEELTRRKMAKRVGDSNLDKIIEKEDIEKDAEEDETYAAPKICPYGHAAILSEDSGERECDQDGLFKECPRCEYLHPETEFEEEDQDSEE